jgi:hypothetical protein
MNDGQLSSTTRAMIEAARADGPSAAARAKVWTQVSGAVGAAGTGAAAASAAAGGVSAAKLLIAGALLGGSLTVGLAATMLRVGHVPTEPSSPSIAIAGAGRTAAATPGRAEPTEPTCPRPGANAAAVALPTPTLAPTSTPARTTILAPTPVAARPPKEPAVDPLEREAQLVSEARGALGRGDARRALQAVRAARALPSHQLAPEELAVEAQALRAQGRTGDAKEVDETLRTQFPESALAR